VEDEALEGLPRLPAANQVNDASSAEAPAQDFAATERRRFRRLATILVVLGIAGTVLELPLAIVLRGHTARHLIDQTAVVLAVSLTLAVLAPVGLRISSRIGFPGAPWTAGMLGALGPRPAFINLVRSAAFYALATPVIAAVMLVSLTLPGIALARANHVPIPPMPEIDTSARATALIALPVSIAAGISEEIEFRLTLFVILAAAFGALIGRREDGRPSRAAVVSAALVQSYVFGLMHLLPRAGALYGRPGILLLSGLVMPQTWEGLIFSHLYYFKGLEASILAHAMMDFGLFVIVTLTLLMHF
jgi:membrane protease YdiL (CAAX protease family)